MTSPSPARHTRCRFCGLHAELYGHGSLAECVAALAGEVRLLRQPGPRCGPEASVTPAPVMKMFPDRGVRVPLSR